MHWNIMEESQIDLRKKLVFELSYEFMKNMTRDEYFKFAKGIFIGLIPYKNNGLTKDELFMIANDIHYVQSEKMDLDEVFENRMEILLNELYEYCDKPTFFGNDFEDYIKKWDTYYEQTYIQ